MGDEENEDNGGEYSTPEGDEYSLPIPETLPADATMESIDPIIPANLQEHVGPSLANSAGENNNGEEEEEMAEPEEPLLVRVIKDDDLSSFEKKTMRVAWLGFGVGVLSFVVTFFSLAAAIVAGIIFWGQLDQMVAQSEILGASFYEQEVNAIGSDIATARQISILQGQLTQQSEAMRLDQRAWLVATAMSLGTVDDGKPITYSVTGMNTGKTPGRKVIIHNHASFSAIEIKTEKDLTLKAAKVAPSSVGLVAPNSPFGGTQEEVPAEDVPFVRSRLGEHGCSYVWGEITYEDIFHSQRISTFCSYRCLRSGYESLRWCRFHNEAK